MATVRELLPKFCIELQDLVSSAGRSDLVAQIQDLPVVSRCRCGDRNCAHFFTAEPPAGSYGPGHTNLLLPADVGFIALDLVHDAIVAIEVLDRPDVKAPLDAALPLLNVQRSTDLACAACGFLTVPDSSYDSCNICEVCGWEDDGDQLANPACEGGANQESLIQAQHAALARFPIGMNETLGIRRSPSWRPMTAAEVALATVQRDEKYWMNSTVIEPEESYWLKR